MEAGEDHGDVTSARKKRTKVDGQLQKTKEAIDTLDKFHDEATKYWGERILGHIAPLPSYYHRYRHQTFHQGLGSHRARRREDRLEGL